MTLSKRRAYPCAMTYNEHYHQHNYGIVNTMWTLLLGLGVLSIGWVLLVFLVVHPIWFFLVSAVLVIVALSVVLLIGFLTRPRPPAPRRRRTAGAHR